MSSGTNAGAVPPPPGETPNFVNPEYNPGGTVPVSAIFLTLSTIALALRIYTKARVVKIFGAEDYIVILAYIFNVLYVAIVIIQQHYGNGKHIWDITLQSFVTYGKWAAVSVEVYPLAVSLSKVSICAFYLRINPERFFRMLVYFVLFVIIGFTTAVLLAQLFSCNPISKFWNPLLLEATCINISALYLSNGILNVVTDFLVLLLPVPMLVKLHTRPKQKWVLWGIFATGSLTCIVSAVRIYYVSSLLHSKDTSWEVPTSTTLGLVETNLGVTCASLMVLRPFVRRYLPRIFGGDTYPKPGGPRKSYTPFDDSTNPSGNNANKRSKVEGSGSAMSRGKRWLHGGTGLDTTVDEERDYDFGSSTMTGRGTGGSGSTAVTDGGDVEKGHNTSHHQPVSGGWGVRWNGEGRPSPGGGLENVAAWEGGGKAIPMGRVGGKVDSEESITALPASAAKVGSAL